MHWCEKTNSLRSALFFPVHHSVVPGQSGRYPECKLNTWRVFLGLQELKLQMAWCMSNFCDATSTRWYWLLERLKFSQVSFKKIPSLCSNFALKEDMLPLFQRNQWSRRLLRLNGWVVCWPCGLHLTCCAVLAPRYPNSTRIDCHGIQCVWNYSILRVVSISSGDSERLEALLSLLLWEVSSLKGFGTRQSSLIDSSRTLGAPHHFQWRSFHGILLMRSALAKAY